MCFTYYENVTKNEDFLRTVDFFEHKGLDMAYRHLALFDRDLIGVNPLDENLSPDMIIKVQEELRKNIWYYFREYVPQIDKNYRFNPINAVQISFAESGRGMLLYAPRQSCKTATFNYLKSYHNHIRKLPFINGDDTEICIIDDIDYIKKKDGSRIMQAFENNCVIFASSTFNNTGEEAVIDIYDEDVFYIVNPFSYIDQVFNDIIPKDRIPVLIYGAESMLDCYEYIGDMERILPKEVLKNEIFIERRNDLNIDSDFVKVIPESLQEDIRVIPYIDLGGYLRTTLLPKLDEYIGCGKYIVQIHVGLHLILRDPVAFTRFEDFIKIHRLPVELHTVYDSISNDVYKNQKRSLISCLIDIVPPVHAGKPVRIP